MLGASEAFPRYAGVGGSTPSSPAVVRLKALLAGLRVPLNDVSDGLGSCCQGPPKRRTILDSSLWRHRCFCSAVAKLASVFVDLDRKTEKRSERIEPREDLSAVLG